MTVDPQTDITALKGVGPKLQATLAKLGIFRYIDLLLHLPFRYQDRTRVTPIGAIRAGEEHLIQGRIQDVSIQYGKRRSLKVMVRDESGEVSLRFFHFSRFQQNKLAAAQYIQAFGQFRFFGRELGAAHPEYHASDHPPDHTEAALTPIYPVTQGLGQQRLRKLTRQLCAMDWPEIPGTPFDKLAFLHQPPSTVPRRR